MCICTTAESATLHISYKSPGASAENKSPGCSSGPLISDSWRWSPVSAFYQAPHTVLRYTRFWELQGCSFAQINCFLFRQHPRLLWGFYTFVIYAQPVCLSLTWAFNHLASEKLLLPFEETQCFKETLEVIIYNNLLERLDILKFNAF